MSVTKVAGFMGEANTMRTVWSGETLSEPVAGSTLSTLGSFTVSKTNSPASRRPPSPLKAFAAASTPAR